MEAGHEVPLLRVGDPAVLLKFIRADLIIQEIA
jgi:hypothetical protein